jgi:serine/threonine protein kinase
MVRFSECAEVVHGDGLRAGKKNTQQNPVMHNAITRVHIQGGDFFSLMRKFRRLPESWVQIYIAEIALALQHLHDMDIVYRDLKVSSAQQIPCAFPLIVVP